MRVLARLCVPVRGRLKYVAVKLTWDRRRGLGDPYNHRMQTPRQCFDCASFRHGFSKADRLVVRVRTPNEVSCMSTAAKTQCMDRQ